MVYSTRRFVLCLTLCHFVLVFFGPFSIAVASLGEGRVLFVRLFGLSLFGFVGFLFLLVFVVGGEGGGGTAVCDCGTPWAFFLPFLDCTIGAFHMYIPAE